MDCFTRLFIVTLMLAIFCRTEAVKNPTLTYNLPAFTGIAIELPVRGRVIASNGSTYSASLHVTDKLAHATLVNVSSTGILEIKLFPHSDVEVKFDFPQTVSITVPRGTLVGLGIAGSGILTADPAALNSSSPLGAFVAGISTLRVEKATVAGVNAKAVGRAELVVAGDVGNVAYAGAGRATAFFIGNVTSVTTDLAGKSALYVSSSASPNISGTAHGPNRVMYTNGSCNVVGVGGAVCAQKESISPPPLTSMSASGKFHIYSDVGHDNEDYDDENVDQRTGGNYNESDQHHRYGHD